MKYNKTVILSPCPISDRRRARLSQSRTIVCMARHARLTLLDPGGQPVDGPAVTIAAIRAGTLSPDGFHVIAESSSTTAGAQLGSVYEGRSAGSADEVSSRG